MSVNNTEVYERENQSIENFAASLSTAAVIFGVQIVVFLILSGNWKLRRSTKSQSEAQAADRSVFQRIYYYKTAFVPKRKRIKEPTTAIESFKKVFTISDRELIRVAGVDGYLFLEYLQMLLRIFIPMAIVILPILLPVNRIGDVPRVSGLDSFAWPNVAVPEKLKRLWAHCILACCVIMWVCYNFYLALRKFVRLRQTILTMPEHRIRASATTILVQSIPRKWLTMAALDALYDVFPGGIREIWINREFDDLQEKVNQRIKFARMLEAAETNLIIKCTKEYNKQEAKRLKEAGVKKSKKERKQNEAAHNSRIEQSTIEQGISSGNPHQIEQISHDVLKDTAVSSTSSSSRSSSPDSHNKTRIPIPVVGQGIQAVGDGFRDMGKMGSRMVGGLKGAFGGKHDRTHGPSQADGAGDRPLSSPIDDTRPDSTDTYTPLRDPAKDKYNADGLSSEPQSPQSVQKLPSPTATSPKSDPFKIIKDSPINPLRRMSDFVSPQPFRAEGEEYPMEVANDEKIRYNFSGVYNADFVEDDQDALWRNFIKPKDRETMRIPLFNKSWWPSLPLLGKKVDTIYHCRKELARLNYEIAEDQAHPERYPLQNSAFIQFNHQVAAHMACQSLSHHIPRQMTPRTVEVNPNYILWDNLTMKWYMRYIRSFGVIALIVGLIIFWGIPVSFTGALSQVHKLTEELPWLSWLNTLPPWLLNFIQGVLPPAFLAILFVLLPIILRFLAETTGVTTAGERELLVQNYYFAFVFIQLFLVVSISSGITSAIEDLTNNPLGVPKTLAQSLPRAANYFYSYMILQAFSISSGTLLQVGAVLLLLVGRFVDTTPREKVSRNLSRPGINWGNMIPVYTNFAAIGLIYSVISPLIMIMMLITFSLFWFTYRYQMIYVSYAKAETNGLIFPRAINQTFTGLYFLELCLIGLFFLQSNADGAPCFPQGIIMIIFLGFTVIFQILLNSAFGPLFNYLPITFEDEAVVRDEEFQRAQASRWDAREDDEHRSLNSELEAKERQEQRESQLLEQQDKVQRGSRVYGDPDAFELNSIEPRANPTESPNPGRSRKASWANRSRSRSRSHSHHNTKKVSANKSTNPLGRFTEAVKTGLDDLGRPVRDLESQVLPTSNLFDDIDGSLEDLEPEVRQKLIKRSFQHPATRAIQPVIWIPHDELGIAKDEIQRTAAFTNRIWISSKDARLNASGEVSYSGLPQDRDPFENVEV